MRRIAVLLLFAVALAGCGSGFGLTNKVTGHQAGPFATSCVIGPRGIAQLSFHNNGGRDQRLRVFWLQPYRANGKPLREKEFTYKVTIKAGTYTTPKVGVTYRAHTCKVVKVRG